MTSSEQDDEVNYNSKTGKQKREKKKLLLLLVLTLSITVNFLILAIRLFSTAHIFARLYFLNSWMSQASKHGDGWDES